MRSQRTLWVKNPKALNNFKGGWNQTISESSFIFNRKINRASIEFVQIAKKKSKQIVSNFQQMLKYFKPFCRNTYIYFIVSNKIKQKLQMLPIKHQISPPWTDFRFAKLKDFFMFKNIMFTYRFKISFMHNAYISQHLCTVSNLHPSFL